MVTYAIGDVQGCFDELQALLAHINFSSQDTLWFAGDLINRGPKSLDTLNFIQQLGDKHIAVLGNHDLHCLSLYFTEQYKKLDKSHALQAIFNAPNCNDLMHWLLRRPIFYYNEQHRCILVHAGVPPSWDLTTCLKKAHAIEQQLAGKQRNYLLEHMYGDTPSKLTPTVSTLDESRFTINSFTRMRLLTSNQSLLLKEKGKPKPKGIPGAQPWFSFPNALDQDTRVLFGHWAALEGECPAHNIEALDTGCVWGKKLTAYCIETKKRHSIACPKK